MSDIVKRIRKLRYVHVPVASELMAQAVAEIERLRLTDAEREAIEWAILQPCSHIEDRDDTLLSLLERLK